MLKLSAIMVGLGLAILTSSASTPKEKEFEKMSRFVVAEAGTVKVNRLEGEGLAEVTLQPGTVFYAFVVKEKKQPKQNRGTIQVFLEGESNYARSVYSVRQNP